MTSFLVVWLFCNKACCTEQICVPFLLTKNMSGRRKRKKRYVCVCVCVVLIGPSFRGKVGPGVPCCDSRLGNWCLISDVSFGVLVLCFITNYFRTVSWLQRTVCGLLCHLFLTHGNCCKSATPRSAHGHTPVCFPSEPLSSYCSLSFCVSFTVHFSAAVSCYCSVFCWVSIMLLFTFLLSECHRTVHFSCELCHATVHYFLLSQYCAAVLFSSATVSQCCSFSEQLSPFTFS